MPRQGARTRAGVAALERYAAWRSCSVNGAIEVLRGRVC